MLNNCEDTSTAYLRLEIVDKLESSSMLPLLYDRFKSGQATNVAQSL